jgi:hypothetical protein
MGERKITIYLKDREVVLTDSDDKPISEEVKAITEIMKQPGMILIQTTNDVLFIRKEDIRGVHFEKDIKRRGKKKKIDIEEEFVINSIIKDDKDDDDYNGPELDLNLPIDPPQSNQEEYFKQGIVEPSSNEPESPEEIESLEDAEFIVEDPDKVVAEVASWDQESDND